MNETEANSGCGKFSDSDKSNKRHISLKWDFHAVEVVVQCSLSKVFYGDFASRFCFVHDTLENWVLT